MKTKLSLLPDEEYNAIIAEWESYAGVTTADLIEQYKEELVEGKLFVDCKLLKEDAAELYAREHTLLSPEEYYELEEHVTQLEAYILNDPDFYDPDSDINIFLEYIVCDLCGQQAMYIMNGPDLGISWLKTTTKNTYLYWNMDEIWVRWKHWISE